MKKSNPWKIAAELLTIFLIICMGLIGALAIRQGAEEAKHNPDIRKTIEDIGTYEIDEDDLTIQINTKYNRQDYPYWYGTVPKDYLTVDHFTSEALSESDEDRKSIVIDHMNRIVYFPMRNCSGWIQVSAHAVS